MQGSLTIALNPSVDAEWQVDDVQWEEKNVIRSERRWPGGKGVNVARWLKFLGSKTTLLMPVGGKTGIEEGLVSEKIPTKFVPIAESTRTNYIVTTPRGQMRFNPPGPAISRKEWKSIVHAAETALQKCGLLILSGSLPRGVMSHAYRHLLDIAHRCGVRTLLDCDGEPFKQAVEGRPFLVKPNEYELSLWSGSKITGQEQLLKVAAKLSQKTGGWVLVSRGPKGAVLLNASDGKCFSASAPHVTVQNTVGAGDAMFAAIAHQIGVNASPEEWLKAGIAIGTAATQCRAGELPSKALVTKLRKQICVRLQKL